MWAADAVYDIDDPDEELAKLPILHQRYMDILVVALAKKKNLIHEIDRMKREKVDHYRGRSDNPHPVRLTAGETDTYVKSDSDFQTVDAKLEMASLTVDYVERILRVLTSRSYDLRAIIDWRKFTSGV